MSEDALPEVAWSLALLSLPKLGPARLADLVRDRAPRDVWNDLCQGRPVSSALVGADRIGEWRQVARVIDVGDRWRATSELGISVVGYGGAGYPKRLLDDIEPPAVIFSLGRPLDDVPTVAIVGTRQCTAYGRRAAFELGAALAAAGVHVVSGLALGIDAAAHQGALSVDGAPPLGVVGTGLDIVYPRRNRALWHDVATNGTLLAEAPPGSPPERWRFPARNRIIAALADGVIVVESHERGGSLLTVDEAAARDVSVGAIPGPITSAASAGTNALIVDGAIPVRGVDDVLMMIGHVAPTSGVAADGTAPPLSAGQSTLLELMGWEPRSLEELCPLSTSNPAELAADIESLVASGHCSRTGMWIERIR